MTQNANPEFMDGSYECLSAGDVAGIGCCADSLLAPKVGREGSTITVAIKAEDIGFTKDQLTVTVGGIDAPVTAMKSKTVLDSDLQHAEITCKGGQVPRGTYDLRVTSSNQGEASGPGPGFMQPRVEVLGGIDSVTPSTGSVAGGRLATIKGWGFSGKTRVTFGDDAECKVTSTSYSEITCIPPGVQGVNTTSVDKFTASKTDINVFVGTNSRGKLVIQSAGSNLRTTRVKLHGVSPDLIYTITAGLSVTVWDLEKNVQAFPTKTYATGTANYESQALGTFLSKLSSNHMAIIVSHGVWHKQLTKDLVDQLVACGAPEQLRTEFTELTYYGDRAFDTVTKTVSGGKCPTGWTTVSGRCFKYSQTGRTYSDAVKYCQSLDANIASIHSNEENDALFKVIKGITWIGAESDGKGKWRWNDGTEWWQPSGGRTDGIRGTSETKIALVNGDRKWHDWGRGTAKNGVMCAKVMTSNIVMSKYGNLNANSRFALVGVCSPDAITPAETVSRFYIGDSDTGNGTIGTGTTTGTAVFMPVTDTSKVLTLVADTNIFWKSPITKEDAYEHDPKLTPKVFNIYPTISSTAGGATVTITGDNFGSDPVVTLGGKVCAWKRSDIGSYRNKNLCDWGQGEKFGVNCTGIGATSKQIVCITNPISIAERPIVNTPVRVNVEGKGYAITEEVFTYFDRWSATTTWGYLDPPAEGDLVGLLKEDVILYDMNSPSLAVLVIEGSMVFDDTQDLELRAKYILVKGQPNRKASFIIGTELHRHKHKAIITLEGNRRMRELPLYGGKVLAVRHAVLDFHGEDRFMWTRLSATGSNFWLLSFSFSLFLFFF